MRKKNSTSKDNCLPLVRKLSHRDSEIKSPLELKRHNSSPLYLKTLNMNLKTDKEDYSKILMMKDSPEQ